MKVTGFFLSHIALVRIYQKGWQLIYLILDRSFKDVSPENVYLIFTIETHDKSLKCGEELRKQVFVLVVINLSTSI